MLIMIDNYDSFTYNLVQYFGELGQKLKVFRNDVITVKNIALLKPAGIVISSGPCTPKQSGISCDAIRELGKNIPILGVCLGHQCIGEVFGGEVVRAKKPVHGKTSKIYHDGKDLFKKIENPFEATRYHSLIVKRETLPSVLTITAWTKEGEIMGLKHKEFPIWGVQFHPESILTKVGKSVLKNFLKLNK
ncbi:anthranilate/aminodeoxychorismate synthase component II [bacterium Unc6]|nr:anthranilate/aminodeoxychorismate synthase component II [bacterium Unc6]